MARGLLFHHEGHRDHEGGRERRSEGGAGERDAEAGGATYPGGVARKAGKRDYLSMARSISVPPEIPELVERFGEHIDEYRNGHYNETQVRREYIDPLFIALGWDVNNTKGHAEAYKDVIHEDAIKIGGVTKAPDYCFRIGGVRKFFVEAKKPSVDVKHDVHPAYQLRRYAWSAKLPLSILTDFEELAVYDTRVCPKRLDKASAGRVNYIAYQEYPDRILRRMVSCET